MRFPAWLGRPLLIAASLSFASLASVAPVAHAPVRAADSSRHVSVAETAAATSPPESAAQLVAYGRAILTKTQSLMKANVTAGMSCQACHLSAGTKAHGLSLIGTAARFPQWNPRARRYILLQDRLAECFLYSMNGTPPSYDSRDMIALAAYVTSLSSGEKIGSDGATGQSLIPVRPARPADPHAGQGVYMQKCAACHGSGGQGGGGGFFPPLWGAKSFNNGAGMNRVATMAAFVRYNMPYGGAPNVLSQQQAYDVSAYILSRPRPAFDKTRSIAFPPVEAGTI